MPPQAAHYLVDYLSDTGLDITTYNYDEYFGDHYLDTTHTAVENSIVLYVIAAVFTVLGIIIFQQAATRKRPLRKRLLSWNRMAVCSGFTLILPTAHAFFTKAWRCCFQSFHIGLQQYKGRLLCHSFRRYYERFQM